MSVIVTRAVAWVFLLLGGLLAMPCEAQSRGDSKVNVSCSVSGDSCYAGDGVDYVVNVSGSASPERPSVEMPAGLSLGFVGGSDRSSRFVAIENGKRSERVEEGYVFQFRVTAERAGEYVIPAPKVVVGGKEYRGNPLRLRVLEPETDNGFGLSISVDNDAPYVGEPVRMRVMWRLAANVKNISIAALPGQEAFELATPHDRVPTGQQNDPTRVEFQMFGRTVVGVWSQEVVGGQATRVLSVEQVIVPKEAGTIELGPMSIAFDAVVGQKPRGFFDSPFDARDVTKRVVSRSNAVKLRVKALPERGRPADFRGLVGEYSVKASASATEVGVGEPFNLSVTIEGPDPLARIENPPIEEQAEFGSSFRASPEGWVAEAGPESNPRRMSISIRATDAGVSSIPALRFPYFDPKRGEYRVASSAAIPLKVRATRVVTTADGVRGESGSAPAAGSVPLALKGMGLLANSESADALVDEGWGMRELMGSRAGLAALAGPPVVCLAAVCVAWRRRVLGVASRRLSRERARGAAALRRAQNATQVHDALQGYVGVLMGREASALSAEESVGAIGDWWPELGSELGGLMRRCDSSRFGGVPTAAEELRADALSWLERVHRQALRDRRRWEVANWSVAGGAVLGEGVSA